MKTGLRCSLCVIFLTLIYWQTAESIIQTNEPGLLAFLQRYASPVLSHKIPWTHYELSPKYSLACAKSCVLSFLDGMDTLTDNQCLEGQRNMVLFRDMVESMYISWSKDITLNEFNVAKLQINAPDKSKIPTKLVYNHIFTDGDTNIFGEIVYEFEFKSIDKFGGMAAKQFKICLNPKLNADSAEKMRILTKFHGLIKKLENSFIACGVPPNYLTVSLEKSVKRTLDHESVKFASEVRATEIGFLDFVKNNLHIISDFNSIYPVEQPRYSAQCMKQCLIKFFSSVSIALNADSKPVELAVEELMKCEVMKPNSQHIFVSDSSFPETWQNLNMLAGKVMQQVDQVLETNQILQDSEKKLMLFGNILKFEKSFIACGAPYELTALNIETTFKLDQTEVVV